jgi:acyl-CoA synthetase (NDP forming)
MDPLYEAEVPVFAGLESAARAMATLAVRAGAVDAWRARPAATASKTADSQSTGARPLTEPEAREWLTRAGIALPPFRVATTADEARARFVQLGGPVAMKLVSAEVLHKSDVGGVILHVESADAAEAAFERLGSIAKEVRADDGRVLLTPMISAGIECLIGGATDAKFGPVVSFGAGGILVELMEDVVFLPAPIDEDQARKMIVGTRVHRLLQGFRGRAPADLAALIALLTATSRFVAENPSIVALDLNPVIVNETGAHVADVRILESKGSPRSA